MKAAFPESDGDQGSFTFRSTIQDRFESYHAAHPEVYFVLVQLCGLAKQRGITKLGVSLLWERMRWSLTIERDSESEADYMLNNDFRSRYARLIMKREPEMAGLFNLRELRVP